MKIVAFNEAQQNEEKTVRLRLQQSGNAVTLVAVNAAGKEVYAGSILTILSDGQLRRSTGVFSDIGLKLDSSGRIQLFE